MFPVQVILQQKGRAVHHVSPDATVFEALRMVAQHNCGALPVLEGGRPVGMLSERDYARKVVLAGKHSKETPVREIMTAPIVYVTPDTSIEECMAVMTERRIRHLPVLTDDRDVAGIVSIGDVVKFQTKQQTAQIRLLTDYITSA